MKKLNVDEIKHRLKLKVPEFAEKVAPAYKVFNWTWGKLNSNPTKDEIEQALYELIDELHEIDLSADTPSIRISSGGLSVGYDVAKSEESGYINGVDLYLDFTYKVGIYNEPEEYFI